MAPENSTAGKHSIGRASVALGTFSDCGGGEQAEAEGRDRAQGQAGPHRGVGRVRATGQAVQEPKDAQHPDDDEEEERHEDGHLRRHVGAESQADEVLAAQDCSLGADLQQAIGEPEEERGEDDPEADHHHRARARVLEIEGARLEEDGEHADDHCRRPDQDREGQAVAHERLQCALVEDAHCVSPLATGRLFTAG
jgi:hypothetical protein